MDFVIDIAMITLIDHLLVSRHTLKELWRYFEYNSNDIVVCFALMQLYYACT